MDIQIDVNSAIWGAGGATIVFLLSWAGKHFLDRVVLPRVLDWWARRTKEGALKRAEKLLVEFQQDLLEASDVRLLIMQMGRRLDAMLHASLYLTFGIAGLVYFSYFNSTLNPALEGSGIQNQIASWFYFVPVGSLLFLLFGTVTMLRLGDSYFERRAEMYSDLTKYRKDLVARLSKLLNAGGLGEEAASEWLLKLPPLLNNDEGAANLTPE